MDTLSLNRILIDGTLFCAVTGVLVFGSLYLNPRLWLQDYPKEMQAKVPPLTSDEKRMRAILAVVVILLAVGIPFLSVRQLRADNGGSMTFLAAYVNAYLVFQLFNLFDAVVIDFLVLTLMSPKFAVLPGTEGMEYLYRNWGDARRQLSERRGDRAGVLRADCVPGEPVTLARLGPSCAILLAWQTS